MRLNIYFWFIAIMFCNTLIADETHKIVINEVMSENDTVLADEYGEFHDWIEIYNAGDESVNLKGYGLSDNESQLFKWTFPDIEFLPSSYLVVFASSQDRTNGSLHTNFKLSSDGETLSLTLPDSNLIDRIEFDEIPTDISIGKKDVESSDLFYFVAPTPGNRNTNEGFNGICSSPDFSSPGGFVIPFFLTLSSDSDDETIHYTLDGSVPNEFSTVYSSPIWITGTTVVSAVCYESDCIPGSVKCHSYYSVFPDILTSTRLPIVIVETLGTSISNEPKIRARMSIIFNGENNLNDISSPFNEYDGWIGIEYRGQTSQGFPKKQFGIETRDEIDRNLNISLFGFPKENDWILHAPYSDKTLMRNVLAYSIAEDMGQYASRTKYCELILNGKYQGVYVFMEKLKHDKNRVDLSELHPYQLSEPEISGGYFLKTDKEASQFITPSNIWMTILSPDGITIPATQKNWIKNYVCDFEASLANPDFTNQTTGYSKYINVDSFIDYYLIIQALRNIDGFRISTYYCKDRNEKLKMGPIWDFNIALGNVNYYDGWKTNGWYHSGSYFPFWWLRLLEDPNYFDKCKKRWQELRKNVLDSNILIEKIDAITNQLKFAQQRNFEKWDALGSYVWPNAPGYEDRDTYEKEVDWMKTWLIGRLNWIDSEYDSFFANFYSSKHTAFIDEEIHFLDSSVGNPQTWLWNFGEIGGVSAKHNPLYSYSNEGLYTISLTVSNSLGVDTCVKTNYINIIPEPISIVCLFVFFISKHCIGLSVGKN